MKLLKLPLKVKAFNRRHGLPWTSCAPFVDNERAILLHRPKSVTTFQNSGRPPHIAVENWCGNVHSGTDNFSFLDSYNGQKLLCARCEANATAQGLPNADDLAGKHLHKGKLIAVQTCCTPEINNIATGGHARGS